MEVTRLCSNPYPPLYARYSTLHQRRCRATRCAKYILNKDRSNPTQTGLSASIVDRVRDQLPFSSAVKSRSA